MAESSAAARPAAASRPGRRRLTAGLLVLAWCAVVAVAATAGWLVVDRAGVSLFGSSGPGLSPGVGASTATATPAAAVAGNASTLTTTGGRVSAVCTPDGRISLQSAIPATDWRVETDPVGPRQLAVEFRRSSSKVEVHGVCRAGVPVLTLDRAGGSGSTSGPGGTSSPSTSDDRHGGSGATGGSGSGGSGSGGSGSGGSGSGGSGKGGSGDDGSGKDSSGGGSGKGSGSSDDSGH